MSLSSNQATRLRDGFKTLHTLANAPAIKLFEKEATPPGITGGGPVDTTTMLNLALRTQQPKQLASMSEAGGVCAYDPAVYDEVLANHQVNQLISTRFSNGGTLSWWGWLEDFMPQAAKEGEMPTANVKFLPSNEDDAGVETLPVYTPPA